MNRQLNLGTQFRLSRLPAWGEMVNKDCINFEWPTRTMFASMDPHVRLTKLTFKTDGGQVSSVKCTYSDDSESPAFENSGFKHHSSEGSVTFHN